MFALGSQLWGLVFFFYHLYLLIKKNLHFLFMVPINYKKKRNNNLYLTPTLFSKIIYYFSKSPALFHREMSGSEEAQASKTNTDPKDESLKFALALSLLRSKLHQNQPPPPSNLSDSDALRWKRKVPLLLSHLSLCYKKFLILFVWSSFFFRWSFRPRSESKSFSDSEKISRKLKVQIFISLPLKLNF